MTGSGDSAPMRDDVGARRFGRVIVFGNSGSGKSTLSRRLAGAWGLAHLDLDVLAWAPSEPPIRRPLAESLADVDAFIRRNRRWVIEGCYADLFETTLAHRPLMVFLDPGIESCMANAGARPWEPHKYATREAQDEQLEFLIGWIREYETRDDEFSRDAHRALFDAYQGDRIRCASNEETERLGAREGGPRRRPP